MLNAVKLNKSVESAGTACGDKEVDGVVYKLRDHSLPMVKAWQHSFWQHTDCVEISHGDIFKHAPAADAIVSPANSFGFMDGGIDMVYSLHFGWQMMKRLQEEINRQKDGELLVGDALIIPAYEDEKAEQQVREKAEQVPEWSIHNEGQPIKYLISAPTMRTPIDVSQTVNAYLAFRAVILAVKRHNADSTKAPIRSVLCPGLGTAVGMMPAPVCAKQMLRAYERFHLHKETKQPTLHHISAEETKMKSNFDD
ncbi:uncharacterized protein LOC143298335 [Babylonia areolata]|uniref:uncharacterized protein LOC143298335 n=1 Tax=Babylonia areolata TaxID=304850 RepID=UPI003FD2EAD8